MNAKNEYYSQRTEARYVELEVTVRTLQRKVFMLEKDNPSLTNFDLTGPPGTNNAGLSQNCGYLGHQEASCSYGSALRTGED